MKALCEILKLEVSDVITASTETPCGEDAPCVDSCPNKPGDQY